VIYRVPAKVVCARAMGFAYSVRKVHAALRRNFTLSSLTLLSPVKNRDDDWLKIYYVYLYVYFPPLRFYVRAVPESSPCVFKSRCHLV
jgi:hypothetical protein